MSFSESCYQQNKAINKWMMKNPGKLVIAVSVILISMWLCMNTYLNLFILGFGIVALYSIVVQMGDSSYKNRTQWYQKHRCEKCGQFVAPEDE
jgi:hypothetical protein